MDVLRMVGMGQTMSVVETSVITLWKEEGKKGDWKIVTLQRTNRETKINVILPFDQWRIGAYRNKSPFIHSETKVNQSDDAASSSEFELSGFR